MALSYWKRTGLGVAALVLVCGTYFGAIQLTGNFSEVLPGQLYRSAQPTAGDIAFYAQRYGIKTIVNLRGSDKNKSGWYADEVAAAQKANITLIDFRMSARRELTPEQAHRLIALLKDAPKPILIHCKSGSDRTGLVSVIYLNQIAGVDEDTAEGQLSLRFGHIGIPLFSSTYAMDRTWEDLEKTFGLTS